MKYPTLEAVHLAQEANDFECLKCWHDELPSPRTGEQHHTMHEIERSLVALGKMEEEDCVELLFEIGGEA